MREQFVSLCAEKGLTFGDAGGGKKALMFQKKSSNIIQRDSI